MLAFRGLVIKGNREMQDSFFKNKKVLVTGNTGFKGCWLTSWLLKMEANIIGISIDIPTSPSLFETLNLEDKITHYFEDVRNCQKVNEIIQREKPDFIFHLAAQAIVSTSYSNPFDTISTNAMGTVSILEALRNYESPCTAIFITSDKCYNNVEWEWGYKETDTLGGKDIYSGSKAMAELAIKSYFQSFLINKKNIRIAVGRAGNVIGGGDWAQDRIVVDCMKAWSIGQKVKIRCPQATRPWQHVLEPLSGYLTLATQLYNNKALNGEAFNFGPRFIKNHTVVELMESLSKIWNNNEISNSYVIQDNVPFNEAGLLKLNCDKALFHLDWVANLDYEETVSLTGRWYYSFYKENERDLYEVTIDQISEYEQSGMKKSLVWKELIKI